MLKLVQADANDAGADPRPAIFPPGMVGDVAEFSGAGRQRRVLAYDPTSPEFERTDRLAAGRANSGGRATPNRAWARHRVILVPDFGSADAWEAALVAQQRAILGG